MPESEKPFEPEISPELRELGIDQRVYKDLTEGSRVIEQAVAEWQKKNPNKKLVVVIAGPTASGKDSFIERLHLPKEETTFLSLDRYYLGAEAIEKRYGQVNFSTPEALDVARIQHDVAAIMTAKTGEAVSVPTYNMLESRRTGEEELPIHDRLVIEGVYALDQVEIETPFRLYLHTEPDLIRQRKLRRDVKERGLAPETVKERFAKNVLPAIKDFVEPQKAKANIIVENNEEDREEYA